MRRRRRGGGEEKGEEGWESVGKVTVCLKATRVSEHVIYQASVLCLSIGVCVWLGVDANIKHTCTPRHTHINTHTYM